MADEFIKEVWGLQGTSYAVLGLRYYARIKTAGWGGLAWDDLGMLLATFTYTAESVMAYFVVAWWKGYANNAMTDAERAALDPNSEEYYLRVSGSKTHVTGLLLYTTLLWLLKGCWVFYYMRLTEGVQTPKNLVFWSYIVMPVTYVSCLLVAFFKCIPFDHQWQIYPNPGNNCMPAVSTLQTVWVMIMNTLTDIYLMAIPLPMIWKAQLPWKKKLSIMFMFSGGFLEMAFGMLRCISILTVGDSDPAQSGYWSVRESFVSYVLTNLPIVYPLIRGFIEKGRTSLGRSNGATGVKSGLSNSGGYRLDSYPGHSRRKDIESASKENIVPHYDTKATVYQTHTSRSIDDQASQDSDNVVYIQSPRSPVSANHQVTVLAEHGRSATLRKQGTNNQASNLNSGIVVTREYEFTVSGQGGR